MGSEGEICRRAVRFLHEYFLEGSPGWLCPLPEGFHDEKWHYCLLKVENCCIASLMRDCKVRLGRAVQEKQLVFGCVEQACGR